MPPVVEIESESNYAQRISEEQQLKNKNAMLAREEDLIFVSPILEGFSLKNKIWRMSPFHLPLIPKLI